MGHHERNHGPTIDADADSILRVGTQQFAAGVVIAAVGEVDLASADRLTAAVQTGFEARAGTVVVDLSEVTFLSSVGLAVLLEAQRTADQTRQRLRIVVGPGSAVVRVLEASGLSDRLPLFPSLDAALAAA